MDSLYQKIEMIVFRDNKVTGQVCVDEQHRRIRNLQANFDSTIVYPPIHRLVLW